MPRQVAFDEARRHNDGGDADHDLDAAPGGALERLQARISAGKDQPFAHGNARRSGDDDGRYFQRAVYPDGQERVPEKAPFDKEILEGAQHDAVSDEDGHRADRKKNAHHKGQEGHKQVVQGNAQGHAEGALLLVNRHRVARFYILHRHLHIRIPQDNIGELLVHCTGYHPDQAGQQEDQEGSAEFCPRFVDELRQLVGPEGQQAAGARTAVFVDAEKDALRQPVEVNAHRAVGVERAGVGKVVRDLHEEVIQLVGVFPRAVQGVLKLPPLVLVLLDEVRFAHLGWLKGCSLGKLLYIYNRGVSGKVQKLEDFPEL